MKIVTASEMREIDRLTSERFGVPSLTLMENAGTAVSDFVLATYPSASKIGVVCGKGNNGGDGFVVARKLLESGKEITVLLLCGPTELTGDAAEMFRRFTGERIVARNVEELQTAQAQAVFKSEILVDAILGTGFRPPVSALYADAIASMNASGAKIIAVDIPSGGNADAMVNQPSPIARADSIVTFTAPRPAHVFSQMTAGPTVCAWIGSPDEAIVS